MRRNYRHKFINMGKYLVCILLCILQRFSVNGQKIVSYNDDVIVTSSSQIDGDTRFYIHHAVDGNADTNADTCNCCAATNDQNDPWFKVDLIQEYKIQRIHVIGRTDYPHTLHNMEIQLGTTASGGTILQGVNTGDTDIRELDYTLTSPELARYITLTLQNRKLLFVICELYIYAACTGGNYGPDCVNQCGKCKNNEPCDGVTGACLECVNGYQSPLCNDCIDGYYGSTCEPCGKCNINDVCDKSNGKCPNGCSAGYQGNTCEQVCTGGKYGQDCENTCGKCNNNQICDSVTGACSECINGYESPLCNVCIAGRYGTTCNEICGQCNNVVCENSDGRCPSGCSAGYKGTTCKEVCSWGTYGMGCGDTCGTCENNETCNNVDGQCTACATGYLSPTCYDCTDGRYGSTCELCGHCNNNDVCDKSNGNCPSVCSPGYQGSTCKQVCTPGTYGDNCIYQCGYCENNAACNNVDGSCIACATGYLSPICIECIDGRFGATCNGTCGQCYNSAACEKNNGNCPNGCSAGFQGSTCKEECEDGTFGLGCEEKCGNCFNGVPCIKIDGSCATCAAGYEGESCLNKCQAGTFGFNCIQRCGMCFDEHVCDIYTGECPNGCNDEYKGIQCLQEINQDTSSSSEKYISLPVFIGSLFAVVVLTVTIVLGLVWLCYRKRFNKKARKEANNENTSIPLPNTPSNYNTLRFNNLNGESTYTELNRNA